MLLDGEQLAGANAPDHYEAVLLAESIDSAWMAAFDASSLSSSASSAAAARGNSTREAALQVDVEGDGDHIVRLTAPLTRYRTATAPFVSPLVTSLAPMPVWVREARVAQPCDSFDLLLTRPVAPSAAERLIQHGTVFAARSMSTYAWDRASGVRLGDPICDHFAARIAPGRQIYAVADGCGWGQPSARAAQAASRTFVNYIHSRRRNIVDLKSASLEVLLAMAEANANVKRSTTGERIGTTTLVGGVMVKLEFPVVVNAVGRLQQKKQQMRTRSMEMDSSGAPHGGVPHGVNSNSSGHITVDAAAAAATSNQCAYAFVLATVGDVKVFHYQAATQTCCDVSRHVVIDHNKFKSEDPGGRLGAQIDGDADLRNLAVLIVPCAAGDAFAMLSDGVHDNLDPEKLGVLPPPDMGGQQWGALPIEVVDFVKRRFQRHFLEGVLRVASGLPRSAARDAHHGSSSPHDFLSRSPRAAVDFIATRIGGHRAMSQSAHSLSRDPSPVRDAHAEDDAAVDGGGGDKLRRSGYRKARKSSTAARPESDSRENLLAPPTPQPINAAAATEELIAFSRYVTKTSRKFMWNNPRLQLPNDFTSVPGKQDHGTCLICVVGDNGLPSV